MMKKLLFIAVLTLVAMQTLAGNVDMATAQSKATDFLRNKAFRSRLMTSNPSIEWTHEVKNSSNASLAALYIINTDMGYVIVAGDDRARNILAYGDGSLESMSDIPENMQYFLGLYQAEMEYLQAHPGFMPMKLIRTRSASVEPLLATSWNQDKPYNMKTPKEDTGSNPYNRVGSSTVSLAQVMNMDYALDKSGAQYCDIEQAIRTFGYDAGAHYVMREDFDTGDSNYTAEEWGLLIQNELAAGRPLVYCAIDMSSNSTGITGYAFNIDGYNADYDTYHVNFGTSADKNGCFALNAFTLDSGMTVYDFYPLMFVGLQPPKDPDGPGIMVSPETLNMQCYAGETTTARFNVVGVNLTDGITVTVTDANGVFTTDVAAISVEDADNKFIIVTYAPQAEGDHTATITLSSTDAEDVVVTLNGTATNAPLVTYTPVMLPADSDYIRLTSFRADWTDQTAAENVASYTLEVRTKPTGPAVGDLLAEADWSNLPFGYNDVIHASDYMPEGWGYSLQALYLDGGCISMPTDDYIYTNTLDLTGIDKVTVVITGKDYNPDYKHSGVTVSTSIDQVYVEFTSTFEPHTVVLNCTSSEQIKFTASYYPDIQAIRVYAGEVEAPQLHATETGDENYRLITGITDKFYNVENLAEAGTFLYKVKAIYEDGTESAWSNVEEVTLFDNGPAPHGYEPGDLNHDGNVSIKDVTIFIDYLLGTEVSICPICADVSGDGNVSIKDVTTLIDMLLGNL